MTAGLKHIFVSAKPAASDPTKVGSVEWNDTHTIDTFLLAPPDDGFTNDVGLLVGHDPLEVGGDGAFGMCYQVRGAGITNRPALVFVAFSLPMMILCPTAAGGNGICFVDKLTFTGSANSAGDVGLSRTSSTVLSFDATPRFGGSTATGTASPALGSNGPMVTASAPNTWLRVLLPDGNEGFIPVWR